MTLYILLLIIAAIILNIILIRSYCELFENIIINIIVLFTLSLTFIPVIGFSDGLYEGYSIGERQGYLIKSSEKGLIYKTNEAQMQIGTGNLASLQEPFNFSFNDEFVNDINNLIGKKVSIKYSQWLIQPYKEGESRYNLISIEEIE